MFRIAIGSCSCEGSENKTGIAKSACQFISHLFEHLKSLNYSQLALLPELETSKNNQNGFDLYIATHVVPRDGKLLIVIQAFHPTWKFPTYLSLKGIGKKFANGFVVSKDGKWQPASEEILWEYR